MSELEVTVQETKTYWTVSEHMIVDGHTQITTRQFPKLESGFVLIRIYPPSQQSSKAVMIRNVNLREDGGKVFVESTKNPSLLNAELDVFCRSWYSYWIAEDEGELVKE